MTRALSSLRLDRHLLDLAGKSDRRLGLVAQRDRIVVVLADVHPLKEREAEGSFNSHVAYVSRTKPCARRPLSPDSPSLGAGSFDFLQLNRHLGDLAGELVVVLLVVLGHRRAGIFAELVPQPFPLTSGYLQWYGQPYEDNHPDTR